MQSDSVPTEKQNTNQLIIVKGLEGNSPITLNSMQKFLLPHAELLQTMWWVIWICTLLFLVWRGVTIFLYLKIFKQ